MNSMALSELEFAVIDTETTGGRHVFDRVIDVAVFRFKGGEIVDKFQSLINPGRPIPPWITVLTGIDDSMVSRAPTFSEISEKLKNILSGAVFTAHNAPFDYGFIRMEFARLGEDFVRPQCCTLKIARRLLPELPSRTLSMVCEHFLIDIWDRHRAHGDAEATTYVLKNLLKQLEKDHQVKTWADLEKYLTQKIKKKKEEPTTPVS